MASNFSPMYFEQPIVIFDATQALSRTSGALIVTGGVGIGNNLHVAGNTIISGSLTAGSFAVNDLTATNITVSNLLGTNANLSNTTIGNVVNTAFTSGGAVITNAVITTSSIGTLRNTDFINTNMSSSSAVIVDLSSTNETNSNFVNTNMTSTNAVVSHLLNTNITSTNAIITNVVSTNETNSNFVNTNMTSTNAVVSHLLNTNITSTNAIITNVVSTNETNSNLLNTNMTSTNAVVSHLVNTNMTGTNILVSNMTAGTINASFGNYATVTSSLVASTTVSAGSVYLSGDINVAGTLTVVNITATNLVDTNITAGIARITTNLAAIGDSNTLGSIYTTGGSVGIGSTAPTATLDVNGTAIISTSVSSAALYSTNLTSTNAVVTNITAGALFVTGGSLLQGDLGVTGASTFYDNVTVTTANVIISTNDFAPLLNGTASENGSILMNTVDVSPSLGDISREREFAAGNGIDEPTNITGFTFDNLVVRAFDAIVSVTILAGGSGNLYAYYNLKGVQKLNGWVLNSSFVGDVTGFTFSITNSGQILYTSTSIGSYTNSTINFRALTTTV